MREFQSEALADPPLMLADEPTTGLDSYMAENVIKLMRYCKIQTYLCRQSSINNMIIDNTSVMKFFI